MGTGIIVCGLNGAGKSTLGKALAKRLRFYFFDNEDLFFPESSSDYPYSSPRTEEEAGRLFAEKTKAYENFVFAAVRGERGDEARHFHYAVLIELPKELRLARVRQRSFEKFGSRMMPGGDLYEKEREFFDMVSKRPEDTTEKWVRTLKVPVIRVDGTKTIEDNVAFLAEKIKI
jgi:adenylate kinase family enzyme